MRITVVGATGLIGTKVVERLTTEGHDVVPASRASGTDVLTGKGLPEAVTGAHVLVDVTSASSFEDAKVLAFFTSSSANLVAAAKAAGVRHYVALSIVGVDELPESGYMRAKVVQEKTIVDSGLPYTIVRATQFHEFTETITDTLIVDGEVRAPDALVQPVAAADVSFEIVRVATSAPVNGVVDFGGPETMSFADMARAVIAARGDKRPVVVDAAARYFGAHLRQTSLVTGAGARLATTRLDDWLERR